MVDHEQDKLFLALELDGTENAAETGAETGNGFRDDGATWTAAALDPAEVPTCPGLHDAMAQLLAKCGIDKLDAKHFHADPANVEMIADGARIARMGDIICAAYVGASPLPPPTRPHHPRPPTPRYNKPEAIKHWLLDHQEHGVLGQLKFSKILR